MAVIDLHAHVLHGLDDGPEALEQSLAMLRLAAQAGTKEIVATPHFSRKYPLKPALAQRRWEELQHLAGDSIRIHKGCEAELTADAVRAVLAAPRQYTIRGLRYLLAAVPDDMDPDDAEPLLNELAGTGLRVILAHPEAHPALAGQRRRLERWVERGILLQVNAASLLRFYGSRAEETATRLLKFGLVHFIASDAHDLEYRPPRLDVIRLRLMGFFPPEFIEQVLELHPQAVVEGQELPPGPLRAPYLKRSVFQFWR